jgi:mercuric ion binding protein
VKSTLAGFALLAALMGTNDAFAGDRTTTLRVRNMTCALCPLIVQRAIATIPGIKEIIVSTDNGTATIVYNERATNPTELAETVAHAGYPAWPIRK